MAGIADKGLNVADMQSLIAKLGAQCSSIHTIIMQIQGAIDSTTWVGADSNRFRADWQSHLRPSLNTVQAAIEAAKGQANKDLQEQITASS